MEHKINFEEYLRRYTNGSLSDDEKLQLEKALGSSENVERLRVLIKSTFDEAGTGDFDYNRGKVDKMIQIILQNSQPTGYVEGSSPEEENATPGKGVYRWLRPKWIRYAAAAILVGAVTLQLLNRITSQKEIKRELIAHQRPASKDILPGANKAVLTLSNGQNVILNNDAQQMIADEGIHINNNNGTLSYNQSDISARNTLTTPNGGQYKLTLSDGTGVWLNAASSITYPTSFSGDIREVSIKGEVYFEVAKNALKPFIVKTYKDEIMVKGTSFNVNSYTDEADVKTTLLEGLVQINNTLLRPGNAYIAGKVEAADIDKELAWKNGVFNFHHVKLTEAMRQIARWYDVEVRYEDNVENIELGGEIGRNLTLQQLLNGLQNIDIHFRLEGKTLIAIQ